MVKIDPQQLLSLIRSDLTAEGGIRNEDTVLEKLTGMIPKFSNKLVSRCVYLNILMKTDEQALDLCLENKGWETLNIWLKDAKQDDNQPFLMDMLQLLLKCPVTVDRLKKTDTAKVVKALVKMFDPNAAANATPAAASSSSSNEELFQLADLVMRKWKALISGSAAAAADSNAVSAENGTSSSNVKPKKNSVRKNSADAAVGDVNGSGSSTVTAMNGGSSGQGLAVAGQGSSSNNNKVKSGDGSSNNVMTMVNAAMNTGPATAAATAGNDNGTNVTAAGVTSPSSTITHSDLFMSMIAVTDNLTPKRKKKPSISDTDPQQKKPKVTPANASSSTTTTKMVTSDTDSLDPLDDSLSQLIEQDMTLNKLPPVTTSPAAITRSLSTDLPITPPVVARSGSFLTPTSSSSSSLFQTSTPTSIRQETAANFETPTSSAMDVDKSGLMTPGPDKSFPRGCLHYSTSMSSTKKKVRWLPDHSNQDLVLTRVKFFDATADERVNVFRQQMQQDQMNESKQGEGNAFRDRSSNESGGSADETSSSSWRPLIAMDGISAVVRGKESLEKEIESERQRSTLAAIYVLKEMCPDSPAEPDPVPVPLGPAPVIKEIPAGPTDGTDSVDDWSKNPIPLPHNNPLFGETFLQPHQMELDRHAIGSAAVAAPVPLSPYATGMIPNPANIALDHQQQYAASAAAAAASGSGFMFASSYERPPFTGHPKPSGNSNNNSRHRGPGGRGGGHNNHNGNNPSFRRGEFLPDIRDAQGRRVCTYFYKTGACSRNPCKFIHMREGDNWN